MVDWWQYCGLNLNLNLTISVSVRVVIYITRSILDGRMEANLLDWCDRCGNSFLMPACIQSLQVCTGNDITPRRRRTRPPFQ